MTNSPTTPGPIHPVSPIAAFLSYLVPGLGQIYQGRYGKGVLFLACVYVLFFYGNALGSGKVQVEGKLYTVSGAVYLPDVYVPKLPPGEVGMVPPPAPPRQPFALDRIGTNLYNRLQFVGQFWVGIAAWPAIYQYALHGGDPVTPDPKLGLYMREPSEESINAVQTTGSKAMDLGWVFTVIAGVLNIMIIYDALAGPAVPRAFAVSVERKQEKLVEMQAETPAEIEPTPTTKEN